MRRTLVILAGFAVISSGLACQHTAGKCDCNPITPPCCKYGLYASDFGHSEPAPKKELIVPPAPKAMPGAAGVGIGYGF